MRKPLRFRQFLTLAALAACTVANAQSVGINGNGAAPDPAAILDIDAAALGTKRGLLIPRMTEAQRLAIPVDPATDNALLVYQTDTGAVDDPGNQRGFWYYDAPNTQWVRLATVKRGWSTRGNTVANVTGGFAEFLGTVNPVANGRNILFRTAPAPANPAMQMGYNLINYRSGFVGLGTAAPATERLEVEGALRLAKNTIPPTHITAPNEGTIRYGTLDGTLNNGTNLNWHWGTLDTLGQVYWSRLENAENFVTPPQPYAKDTVACTGAIGDAYRGNLSAVPVTQTTASPCNYYSPFATNFTPTAAEGHFRVEYLYRSSELEAAGFCFPATISAFAFYVLDQENLDPAPPTTIKGEIRMGVPTTPAIMATTSAAFGANNIAPFMDNAVQLSPIRGTFTALTVSPGWVTFTMTTPLVLNAGQNLIIDIVWSRSNRPGVGPKVELEDPGFLCTKWAVRPNQAESEGNRNLVDDNPLGGNTVAPTANNPHGRRPVTRFTTNIVSPATVQRNANYIQYDGGLMIGSPAWLAGTTFRGPGTIQAQNGVYDAGVLLSDHVFDRYFDGAPRPGDAPAGIGYAYTGLDQLRARLERDRHLPNMPSRSEWEANGGASLGTITTGLWESVEDQALYISQLEKDLSTLEEMAFGTNMSPQEAQRLIGEIQGSKRLTEAQKLHLMDALNEKARPGTPKP